MPPPAPLENYPDPFVAESDESADNSRTEMIWHVTVDEIQRGLKNGVHKVNIDTSGRMAMTGQIRRVI